MSMPARFRQALELIGTECANDTGPGCCRTEPRRSKNALYSADRWCDQCIAAWGLGIEPPSPVTEQDSR